MNYRQLGRTGLLVSEIGFGARAIGGAYGPVEDKWSKVAFSRALGAGCTLFDTADTFGFGRSERLIGSITNCRKDTVIVTKGGDNFYNREISPTDIPHLAERLGRPLQDFERDAVLSLTHSANFSEPYLRFALGQSRQRLRKETIILYLLQNPPLDMIQSGRAFDTLDKLKEEGLIQHYGISIDQPEQGVAAIEEGRCEVIELTYNLLDQDPQRHALLDLAAGRKVGIIIREPLANGILSGKFQRNESFPADDLRSDIPADLFAQKVAAARQFNFLVNPERTLAQAAILFALAHPAVSAVIPGCKLPEQVVENFGAGQCPPLSQESVTMIETAAMV